MNLERFVEAQERSYVTALEEIKDNRTVELLKEK